MISTIDAVASPAQVKAEPRTAPARLWAGLLPHRAFVFLLLAYLATGLWMVYRMPAFSGPNEELHYDFIAHLRRDRAFPDPRDSGRMDERHQPPLYYLTAALAGWRHPDPILDTDLPGNAYYLATPSGNLNPKLHADPTRLPLLYSARLASLFFGLLGLIASYWAALRLASPAVALLVAALLAFQPGWLHLSTVAANDLPAAAMSAIVLALATAMLTRGFEPAPGKSVGRRGARAGFDRSGWLPYLGWGFLFSLAVLTKANAIFLALAQAIVCLDRWRRAGLPRALIAGLAALLGFLPPILAWLAFNQSRGLEGTGVERSVPVAALLTLRPADIRHLLPELGRIWRSVWLDWSRGEVGYAPEAVYIGIGILALAAMAGWCFGRPAEPSDRTDRQPLASGRLPTAFAMHAFWTLGLLGFYLAVKTLMIRDVGLLTPEGRWLLPLAPSLAWLCGMGLVRSWPEGERRDILAGRAALLVSLAGLGLALWLVPHLYPTARLVDRLAADFPLPDSAIVFDRALAIESARVKPGAVRYGEPLELTLTWRALRNLDRDYALAVSDPFLPGHNLHSHPGLGSSPTGGWQAGELRVDRLLLSAPEEAGPGVLEPAFPALRRLRFDLLDADAVVSASRLDGSPVLSPALAEVAILPRRQAGLRELVEATEPAGEARWLDPPPIFGGHFELAALDWPGGGDSADGASAPDSAPALTLWWRCLVPTDRDLVIFVHALDAGGVLLGQADAEPALPPDAAVRSPSSIWRAGDIVASWHSLAGICEADDCESLRVGWYERGNGTRLEAVSAEGERLRDGAVRIEKESR